MNADQIPGAQNQRAPNGGMQQQRPASQPAPVLPQQTPVSILQSAQPRLPSMRKPLLDWRLIVGLSVVLIVLIAAGILISRFVSVEQPPPRETGPVEEPVFEYPLSARIKQYNDASLCDQIVAERDGITPDACRIEIAERTFNAKLCENVVATEGEFSKYRCSTRVAAVQENPALCISIEQADERDLCLLHLARLMVGTGICSAIQKQEGVDSRNNCYVDVATRLRIPAACDFISTRSGEWSKDHCLLSVAIVSANISLCNAIREVSGKFSQDFCYYNLAAQFNDTSLCDKISEPEGEVSKAACISYLSRQAGQTPT